MAPVFPAPHPALSRLPPPPTAPLAARQSARWVRGDGRGGVGVGGVHFGKLIFLWWKGAQTFANEVVTVRVAAAAAVVAAGDM